MDWKKMEFSFTSKIALRFAAICLLLAPTPYAFALSDYLRDQSPEQIATILYFMGGVLFLLLIMPLVQFYLADVKRNAYNQELEQKQNILDSSFNGIVYVDPQGKVDYANDAALTLLGRKRNDILNSNFVINFDESDASTIKKTLKAEEKNETHSVSALVKSSSTPISLHFGQSINQDEKILRVVTLSTQSLANNNTDTIDIDLDAKDAEGQSLYSGEDIKALLVEKHSELAALNERLSAFLEFAPVAIATVGPDYKIKSTNKAMQTRFQYSEKELKKSSIYNLFAEPTEAGVAASSLKQRGRLHDFHVKLKGKDGKTYPCELTIDPINEGESDYILWLIDRADEEFQRVKFENLLSHSGMPMAILDDSGFSKLNTAACNFFNIEDEDELYGLSPDSLQLNVDEEQSQHLSEVLETVKTEGKVTSLSWSHKVGDKATPCEITLVPMFKDHVLNFILCMWADSSEIQKLSNSIHHANVLNRFVDGELAAKRDLLINTREELDTKALALSSTESKLQEVEEDLVNTKTEFSHVKQEYDVVSETLRALEGKVNAGRSELEESERLNAELNQQLEQAASEVLELREQRQKISDAVQVTQDKYEAAQVALRTSEETAKQLNEEKQNQEDELIELLEEVERMRDEAKQKDEQLLKVNAQIETLEAELTSTKASAESLQEKLEKQELATEQAQQQHLELEEHDKQVQQELETKAKELRRLEDALETLESNAERDKQEMESLQSRLKADLEESLSQLSESQSALDAAKALAEREIQDKAEHKTTIDRVAEELRAIKAASKQQAQAISENDENWNKHQAEIEKQKQQLQQSLAETQEQNQSLLAQLEQQSDALQQAEASLQANEQEQAQLQEQLEHAQSDLNRLQQGLQTKEQEEQTLKQQLQERQESIESQEQSIIENNQEKQNELAERLAAVEAQYEQSKLSLSEQQSSFSELQTQLKSLEEAVSESDGKLAEKSEALKQAEQELEASKARLLEREADLLAKHKEELEAVAQQNTSSRPSRPEIERLPMPDRPEIWFDLLTYLHNHPPLASLPAALNQLMDDIEEHVAQAEIAIADNDLAGIRAHSLKLLKLSITINSDALKELMQSVENDCRDGMVDNVSIRWPAIKTAFQRSLRAVYAHLNA